MWEFEEEIGIKRATMKENWINALPPLMNHFLPEVTVDAFSAGQITVMLLQKFIEYFKPKKVNEDSNSRYIVQIFDVCSFCIIFFKNKLILYKNLIFFLQENTPIAMTKPRAYEPPRLIAIGRNEFTNLEFFIYVDQEVMFSGGAVDALLQLFALYWVFNIEYPSDAKIAFIFVAAVLMQKRVSHIYEKYKRVINCLEKLALF